MHQFKTPVSLFLLVGSVAGCNRLSPSAPNSPANTDSGVVSQVHRANQFPDRAIFSQDTRFIVVWFFHEPHGGGKQGPYRFYKVWDLASGKEIGQHYEPWPFLTSLSFFPGTTHVLK